LTRGATIDGYHVEFGILDIGDPPAIRGKVGVQSGGIRISHNLAQRRIPSIEGGDLLDEHPPLEGEQQTVLRLRPSVLRHP
jgi:hypothetical protein